MESFTNNDNYRWIRKHGVWLIESTNEKGEITVLPEGVVPSRAPCRFEKAPSYAEWKEAIENMKAEPDQDIAAR